MPRIRKKSLEQQYEEMKDLDFYDDAQCWALMDIEEQIHMKQRMKIVKKYGIHIVRKVEREFSFMNLHFIDVSAIPPKKIWGRKAKLQKGEEVRGLRFISDCHSDAFGDGWSGTVYIKTKKGFFSIYVRE